MFLYIPQQINMKIHTLCTIPSFASPSNSYRRYHIGNSKNRPNANIANALDIQLISVGSSMRNPLVLTIFPKHLRLSHQLLQHYQFQQHLKTLSNGVRLINSLVTLIQRRTLVIYLFVSLKLLPLVLWSLTLVQLMACVFGTTSFVHISNLDNINFHLDHSSVHSILCILFILIRTYVVTFTQPSIFLHYHQ